MICTSAPIRAGLVAVIFTPGKTAAELYAYVDGRDPITGRPVMQEIVEGLTLPFEEADRGPLVFERTTPRLVEPAHTCGVRALTSDGTGNHEGP